MSVISLSKAYNVVVEFVDSRLMPVAPPMARWTLGGVIALLPGRLNDLIEHYLPTMKMAKVVDENNIVDIEQAKKFLYGAFDKQPKIELFNFILNREDADALIQIMENNKDA